MLMRSLCTLVLSVVAVAILGCPWLDFAPQGTPSTVDPNVRISVQIDAEGEDAEVVKKMLNAMNERGLTGTVYVTGDFASRWWNVVYECCGQGYEIACHGTNTGEQLAQKSRDEQKRLISSAKAAIEGCAGCGMTIPVTGFRPQFFSQNEDTYSVLDELGFTHNSGFKAGLLALPGHEQDVAPYRAEGHQFYAVPISTVEYAGKRIYLCDMSCAKADKLTPEQWLEILRMGLDRAVANKEPLVILVHGIITGDDAQYHYWQPFIDFLDEAKTKGVFVTTSQLVDAYRE